MKYRVLIAQDEDGVYVADVPALPGCISQGKTRAEALNNIQEAIEAYLESLRAHDEPVPPSIDEEVIEVLCECFATGFGARGYCSLDEGRLRKRSTEG